MAYGPEKYGAVASEIRPMVRELAPPSGPPNVGTALDATAKSAEQILKGLTALRDKLGPVLRAGCDNAKAGCSTPALCSVDAQVQGIQSSLADASCVLGEIFDRLWV